MARLIRLLLIGLIIVLVACTPQTVDEPPPDPETLLQDVVTQLMTIDTFKMDIEQRGVEYPFYVTVDGGETSTTATFRRGEAQYKAPNIMYAVVNLSIGGLPPVGVELFAEGIDQWFKLAGSGWINYPIAEGFDPGAFMQEDAGFQAAIAKVRDIEYVAAENLVDGTPVHHIRGVAGGDVVNDLMFNLLIVYSDVIIDVFVDRETNYPAQLILTHTDTPTEEGEDPTTWIIEIYDVNVELEFTPPNRDAE